MDHQLESLALVLIILWFNNKGTARNFSIPIHLAH